MGRKVFDAAYEAAMRKIAFDVDDAEDERVYNMIKNDPKTNRWQKATSDELGRESRRARNWAIGLGGLGAAAGGAAAAFPEARKVAVPVALGAGISGGLTGLGSYMLHRTQKDYDAGRLSKRDVRQMNIDRYMRENGSRHAGRRMQRSRESDAERAAALAITLS